MKSLIIIFILALMCGTTRRIIFEHWKFFIFALPAGILAWCLMPDGGIFGDRWARLAFVLLVAIGVGASCKARLDDIFKRRD